MVTSDILLLGASGSGKTQFINAVTGSDFAIGRTGFDGRTSTVQSSKFVGNLDYVLFDTPGFDNDMDGVSASTTVQIPGELTKLVSDWCRAKSRQLRAIIYFHDLNESRIIPCQLFNIRIMKRISELTGVDTIFVVTTKWDSGIVTEDQRNKREEDLTKTMKKHLQPNVSLIPCKNNEDHAKEVMQGIINSLHHVSSNLIPPMSYPSSPPHPSSRMPSTSTLVGGTGREEPSSTMSPPEEKPGFLGRIWRGFMKFWRILVPSCQQTNHRDDTKE